MQIEMNEQNVCQIKTQMPRDAAQQGGLRRQRFSVTLNQLNSGVCSTSQVDLR